MIVIEYSMTGLSLALQNICECDAYIDIISSCRERERATASSQKVKSNNNMSQSSNGQKL